MELGLGANLVGVTPEKAIKLTVNETIREFLSNEDGSISVVGEIIAGASAGFLQVIATNPMELIKIRMQMQALKPAAQRLGTVAVVKSLGVRGCYQGTISTLCRDVPFSFVIFPLYANLRVLFAGKDGTNSMASTAAAGVLSAMTASGLVTPMDTIKTRLQAEGGEIFKGSVVACAKQARTFMFLLSLALLFFSSPVFRFCSPSSLSHFYLFPTWIPKYAIFAQDISSSYTSCSVMIFAISLSLSMYLFTKTNLFTYYIYLHLSFSVCVCARLPPSLFPAFERRWSKIALRRNVPAHGSRRSSVRHHLHGF